MFNLLGTVLFFTTAHLLFFGLCYVVYLSPKDDIFKSFVDYGLCRAVLSYKDISMKTTRPPSISRTITSISFEIWDADLVEMIISMLCKVTSELGRFEHPGLPLQLLDLG